MKKERIIYLTLSDFDKLNKTDDWYNFIIDKTEEKIGESDIKIVGLYSAKLNKKQQEKLVQFKEQLSKSDITLLSPNETYNDYKNIHVRLKDFKNFANVNQLLDYAKEKDKSSFELLNKKNIFGGISKIKFLIDPSHEGVGEELFNNQELIKLNKIYGDLLEGGYELAFSFDSFEETQYSVEEAVMASRKLQEWVDVINSIKNNKNLSVYEKYLYAYDIVTSFVYHEVDKGKSKTWSRQLIPILNGDRIVCVGYAAMLTELCKRLEIPCVSKCVNKDHQICFVRIDDDKYNIHGIYVSDPTNDCAGVILNDQHEKRVQGFNYSTIPVKDFLKCNVLGRTKNCNDSEYARKTDEEEKRNLIDYFTNNNSDNKKVDSLLKNPSFIDGKICAKAYINVLIHQGLSHDEILSKCKERSETFLGTTTEYSAFDKVASDVPKLNID